MDAKAEKLLRLLDSDNPELVALSVFQLSEIAKSASAVVLEPLIGCFASKSWRVRFNAALALTQVLRTSSLAPLEAEVETPRKLRDVFELNSEVRKHARVADASALAPLLKFSLDHLFAKDWETTQGCLLCLLSLMDTRKLSPGIAEHCLYSVMTLVAEDRLVDYEDDAPSYPVREIAAQVIELGSALVDQTTLVEVLIRVAETAASCVGALLALGKLKLLQYPSALFRLVTCSLRKTEDEATEACKLLYNFPIPPPEFIPDLTQALLSLISETDDLSTCVQHSVLILHRYRRSGFPIDISADLLLPFAFHKTKEVRAAVFDLLSDFVLTVQPELRSDITMIVAQGLLLESTEAVFRAGLQLWRKLAEHSWAANVFLARGHEWNRLIQEERLGDLSFMRILTKSQDEVPRAEFVYCFVDCERDEDPFAASVLQRKQFHRIRTYVKLVLALPTMYQKQALAALNGPFAPLLAVLTSKDRSGLLGEIEKSDGASTLLQARAKGVAAARFLKGCWQGTAQLPPKVAPLLQAIVTCIRCESSEWLLRKVSIAAARAVCLLHGKPAALKLSQNLLGEKPVAFLQALEIVAGSEIFTKVEILRDVVKSTEMSDKNLTLLRLLATHLSGASVKLISHKFEELLNSLSSTAHEELAAKCVLPFLTKLGSSAVLTFVRYFANNLLADEISAVGICYLRLLRKTFEEGLGHLWVPFLPVLTPMLLRHFQEQEVVQTCFGSVINLLPLHVGNSEMPSDLIGLYKEGLQFVDSLRKGLDSQQYQPVFLENLKLREYQREGVSWLLFLARYNLSGILADDMGLGKTVQTLCALVEGHMVSPLQHSLIICPGSVLHHWETELKHYISRSGLRPQIVTPKTNSFTGQILITSYNAVGKLENIPQLLYLVLDEGHLLRNPKTVLYSKIASIKAQKKLILTGTPIQNGVMDIWALFHLLMPGLLGTQEEFSRQYRSDLSASRSANTRAHGNFEFKNEKSALCRLEQLHKQVLPFILRRLKSDVLKDLPDKVIQDYTCQLTELQTQLLTEYQATTHSQLEEINYLRKLSAHPCRVASVPCLLEHSSKLTALSELIRDCEIAEEAGGNHKALIFSQSTKVLDLVERLVLEPLFPKTSFARIDGRISPQERGQVATAFNCLTGPNLLLLTTSVGGLGLNLTAADIVIFLDHSWNPAEDAQAMDRAHRLGQKNVVNVYRLVTEGTIEETVLGLQNFKRRLAQELITEENSSTSQFNIASMAEDLARGSAK